MSANSKIQWTHHTYNPWLGCRKVCDECDKCYIVHQTPLRVRNIKHGSQRHRCADSTLRQPYSWNKRAICCHCGYAELIGSDDCRKCGNNFSEETRQRPRVFCLSLGDWLDNEVPIEWFADLLKVVFETQNLDWLLLTKRPQNWEKRVRQVIHAGLVPEITSRLCMWLGGVPPVNIWIGVSAGVDARPALAIPALTHFLSCEPMLRPLDTQSAHMTFFDWIIFGGESDVKGQARQFDLIDLDRGLRFCRAHGIPAFVKQLGAHPVYSHDVYDHGYVVASGWADHVTFPGGHTVKLRDSHGGDWYEWPEDLRIREFPKPREAVAA